MPCYSRNTRIIPPTSGNSVYAFPRFRVKDLQPVPPAPGLVAGTADKPAVETPADAADGAAVITRHGAATDPVRGVPEGDEGVAASNGEVAARRREGDGETGGCMCVEGMQGVEGGVGHDFYGAFACCREEVEVGGFRGGEVMGEGCCVGLHGLRVGLEDGVV